MSEVIFMFLYDSSISDESYSEFIKIKGLTCIDLKGTQKYANKIKTLPALLINYQNVTKVYAYTAENLEMVINKIKELFT